MSYFRACRRHLDPIESKDAPLGGEILQCPQGHTVHSWFVMDEKGEIVATAFEHEDHIYVGDDKGEEDDWEELTIQW